MNFPLGAIVRYNGELGIITQSTPIMVEAYLGKEVSHDYTKFVPEGAVKDAVHLVANAIGRVIGSTDPSTGSDPEIFGFDASGAVLPAWEWLPNKEQAKPCITHGEGGGTVWGYWDGAQAEITTAKGHNCISYLVDDIQRGLQEINYRLKSFDKDAVLRCEDVVQVPEKYLVSAADEMVALGCAPSENIYDIPPINIGNPRRHSLRYSGCHLHFRNDFQMAYYKPIKSHAENWYPHGQVAMLDKVLGVCLTALGRDLENPKRREAYGRPGEFRMTAVDKLGLEYRTPGAFVLSSPSVFNFACDIGRAAYRLGMIYDGREFYLPPVDKIILNCDADEAVKYIKQNSDFFIPLFDAIYPDRRVPTMRILEKGLRASGLVGTVEKNWLLDGTKWRSHGNAQLSSWANILNVI